MRIKSTKWLTKKKKRRNELQTIIQYRKKYWTLQVGKANIEKNVKLQKELEDIDAELEDDHKIRVRKEEYLKDENIIQ